MSWRACFSAVARGWATVVQATETAVELRQQVQHLDSAAKCSNSSCHKSFWSHNKRHRKHKKESPPVMADKLTSSSSSLVLMANCTQMTQYCHLPLRGYSSIVKFIYQLTGEESEL